MRQAQKQEILEALQSLGQAHEEIKEQLRQGNRHLTQRMPNIQNMLSECQEFAISLGECIERLEGEGHPTVGYIESFCEALYGIYAEIDGMDSERVEANKICKILRKQLIRIENSAKKDIAVRKEVVFLPYKASMWDCMESVWMAARDDEHCDAYVIPIPYYEKKWDESFGQMHYEGNEYPDYVPITGWQEYKIEERRPDIIYIQNPYDDWNTITSVPPQYYTKELKRHTDMLVYLPYFVGINDNVDEYFCIVPGVMNADRVIVQSEKVKNAYIENIQKFEKEHNCVGRYGDLDKKILPLGSPKLDRIRRVMESGKIEIPEEWKDKIYKSNGEKKKIVLYNTTIEAMLKHKEAYIDKIKSVLALFRQEEEFVLLWRPHPLLEITIKTMRPRLYWEYMLIVEEYQEEDWGIFDESADLDRAIVLSDAYYGDWSSVVELYKITKKPIMIQDCEALTS